MRTIDRYDHIVKWLKANSDEIYEAWCNPDYHPAGGLFRFCSASGNSWDETTNMYAGCVTQVRGGVYDAATPKLTNLLRKDKNLPSSGYDTTAKHLSHMAVVNRRIDRELGRAKPKWIGMKKADAYVNNP